MANYYVYCNSQQVYHTLIHNSIFSKALVQDGFRGDTASFLSEQAIFLTKELFIPPLRACGTTEIYFPVILEIADDEEDSLIPVRFVTKKEGEIKVSNQRGMLGQYSDMEGCIGAFAYGEIPISLLQGIYFESDRDMTSFCHASPDLWFPREIFACLEALENLSSITAEELQIASQQADELLAPEESAALGKAVLRRDKLKAINYYRVSGTEGWETGLIKSNVDGALIRFMDGPSDTLKQAAENNFLKENAPMSFEEFYVQQDPVLEGQEITVDKALYRAIMEALIAIPASEELDEDHFYAIANSCLDSNSIEIDRKRTEEYFATVFNFVYTRKIDVDSALETLAPLPILRSLMFFLKEQETFDFLKNACQHLDQNGRRYAYMMFGAYHGMPKVDGVIKCTPQLERHLAKLSMREYPNEWLVSSLPPLEKADTHGLVPEFRLWYNCQRSLELLVSKAPDLTLETIFKAMEDGSKALSRSKFYTLDEPIVVTIHHKNMEFSWQICNEKECKTSVKDIKDHIEQLLASAAIFLADKFRKTLPAESERYKKCFNKNSEMIQEFCKDVEQ